MAIDKTFFNSMLDDTYSLLGDAATFKGTAIECAVEVMTEAEKRAQTAISDAVINIQKSVLDALAPLGIAKSDVWVFESTSYDNSALLEASELEYTFAVFKVI